MPRGKKTSEETEKETTRQIASPEPMALTGERASLYSTMLARWHLSDADKLLLRQAAECLEKAARLSAQVERDGYTFRDRWGGIKKNPSVDHERDFRNLGGRLLNQLAQRLDGAGEE